MCSPGIGKRQRSVAVAAIGLLLCVPLAGVQAESLDDFDVEDLISGDSAKSRFNHRFGYTGNLYRDDLLNEPREAEAEQDIESLSLVSDWHPRGGLFRLSAGLIYQEDRELSTYGAKPYRIPIQFNAAEIPLRGNREDGITPYLGLGWGSRLGSSERIGLNLDLGVLYEPEATSLIDSGSDTGLSLNSDKDWDDSLMKGLEELDLSPVFSLGVSYSF